MKKIVKNRATEPSTALTLQLEFVNFVSLGKVPHGIACLLTLVVFLGTFIAVCSVSNQNILMYLLLLTSGDWWLR
eukprot:SAG31_NODE_350_length_17241_cov_156.139715_14_plen_75_part_00